MAAASRLQRLCGHLTTPVSSSSSSSPVTSSGVHANNTDLPRAGWPGTGYDLLTASPTRVSLAGKTVFISGASRGIGLAIGLRCAREGANVVIAAKTATPHPKLPGTIHTAAEEIRKAGGRALAVECDIRDEKQVQAAVDATVKAFGGIDILVNNASAISLTPTDQTDMKKYDLMHQINARGTFLLSKTCLPYLKKSANPHILTISPPMNFQQDWFASHVAYTLAKFGMSIVTWGLAGELRGDGIACNTLWPVTTIATAAVQNLLGGDSLVDKSRLPDVMGDAAFVILSSPSRQVTSSFFLDEYVLRQTGVRDFAKYAVTPGTPDRDLAADFFVL